MKGAPFLTHLVASALNAQWVPTSQTRVRGQGMAEL